LRATQEVVAQLARRTEAQVASEFRRPLRDLLRDLYIRQGLTQAEIAKMLRVDISTVCRWLQKYQIPARRWRLPDEECAALR